MTGALVTTALLAVTGLAVFYYAIWRGGKFAWDSQSSRDRRRSLRYTLPLLGLVAVASVVALMAGVDVRSSEFWEIATWTLAGVLAGSFLAGVVVAITQRLRQRRR